MGSKGWLKKVHFCISPFTSEVVDYQGGINAHVERTSVWVGAGDGAPKPPHQVTKSIVWDYIMCQSLTVYSSCG